MPGAVDVDMVAAVGTSAAGTRAAPGIVAGGAAAVEYCRKVVAESTSVPDAAHDADAKKAAAAARQEKGWCARANAAQVALRS